MGRYAEDINYDIERDPLIAANGGIDPMTGDRYKVVRSVKKDYVNIRTVLSSEELRDKVAKKFFATDTTNYWGYNGTCSIRVSLTNGTFYESYKKYDDTNLVDKYETYKHGDSEISSEAFDELFMQSYGELEWEACL